MLPGMKTYSRDLREIRQKMLAAVDGGMPRKEEAVSVFAVSSATRLGNGKRAEALTSRPFVVFLGSMGWVYVWPHARLVVEDNGYGSVA